MRDEGEEAFIANVMEYQHNVSLPEEEDGKTAIWDDGLDGT